MIKKVGDTWVLYSADGSRVLGRHRSRRKAQAQEVAINISKARKGRGEKDA